MLAAIGHLMVYPAWQRLTWAFGPPSALGHQYATVAGSWVVYAVWPVLALAVALVEVRRRDV
jgi:hypothetical protein